MQILYPTACLYWSETVLRVGQLVQTVRSDRIWEAWLLSFSAKTNSFASSFRSRLR